MVSTRAAMEARIEELEQRLEGMHEEHGRLSTNLSRQMEQLMRDWSTSQTRGRNFDCGFQHHHHWREGGNRDRASRRGDFTPPSEAPSRAGSDSDRFSDGGWEGSRRPRRTESHRKIDLPIFSGNNTYGWLVHVERYFRVAGVDERDHLELVLVALEGDAFTWFEWWEEDVQFLSWWRFKEDLLKRFQPGAAQNPMGPLLQVKQTGGVLQYRREFELLARAKRNIDLKILMSIFHNGLKK